LPGFYCCPAVLIPPDASGSVVSSAASAGAENAGGGNGAALSERVWENLKWVTPREAAAWLRVSPKLVYRLAESDRTFPAVRVGGLFRISRERLERWLERQHRTRKPLRSARDAVGKTGEPADAAKALR
jgi:excisionase family DNA binding protein